MILGIVLNLKMVYDKAYPTYLFLVMCLIGLIQVLTSYIIKRISTGWQILVIVITLISSYSALRLL
jgi:hypothetical protein